MREKNCAGSRCPSELLPTPHRGACHQKISTCARGPSCCSASIAFGRLFARVIQSSASEDPRSAADVRIGKGSYSTVCSWSKSLFRKQDVTVTDHTASGPNRSAMPHHAATRARLARGSGTYSAPSKSLRMSSNSSAPIITRSLGGKRNWQKLVMC